MTINDIGKRRPYTLKEFVELDYPDFWNGSIESIRVAKEIQKLSLTLLPISRKLLPFNPEQLKGQEFRVFNYLTLRSIYGLTYDIWKSLNTNCHELAEARLNADYDKIPYWQEKIIGEMSLIDSLTTSLDYVVKEEKGYDKLKEIINTNSPIRDFFVKRGCRNGSTWSYFDIVGTIQNNGIDEHFDSLLFDDDPKESNIGGLMEDPKDNKLVVMY